MSQVRAVGQEVPASLSGGSAVLCHSGLQLIGEAHPQQAGQPASLRLLLQMSVSPPNTLTDTPAVTSRLGAAWPGLTDA